MSSPSELKELMTTLDESWNAQDWDTYDSRHSADTKVHWPGKPDATRGRPDHRAEAIEFFKTFPDNHLDLPYRVLLADGDWTCSVAHFTGTMTGPMQGPDGKELPPTGKSFDVEFCTVAKWKNREIVEEKLFYDLVSFMQQIGIG
jgi:predicted ester cyclase